MKELADLQAVVAQLSTDVAALGTAGLISAASLTPITNALTAVDNQIKALLPPA